MLSWIVDTQLPPSLAEFFRRRGFDATHVIDYPSGAMTQDDEIIKIATQENRIIVTKDLDFFDFFILKNYPPTILLLQFGNIKNQDLFNYMDKYLNTIHSLFAENIKRLIVINRNKIIIY
ncbi:MAG: DUF5615 family PIN-like protein [Tannerella sp.]|jgi:predicted nuclease of predicted toxin-antitoxin system|nr:DUF5615 family PIN-like protein [Tannerella sp.]